MKVQEIKPFVLLSATVLMNAVPEKRPSVVDNLLLIAGLSMIIGKPKCGKSTMARQLAVAVANGHSFLGNRTTQGSVLYLSLEGPIEVLADHFKRMGHTDLRSKIYPIDERMSSRENGIKRLEATLDQVPDCRLVVVDPADKFLRLADSNSSDDVGPAMEQLEEMARRKGVQIFLVRHSKKKIGDDAGDAALGSTSFRGGTDTNLFLTKQGTQRILETEQRWGTAMEPTVLLFDGVTGEVSLGRSIEDIENTQHESKERKTHDRIKDALVSTVAERKAITRDELLVSVKGTATTKIDMLAELTRDGILEKVGSGTKGAPTMYRMKTEVLIQGVTQ